MKNSFDDFLADDSKIWDCQTYGGICVKRGPTFGQSCSSAHGDVTVPVGIPSCIVPQSCCTSS